MNNSYAPFAGNFTFEVNGTAIGRFMEVSGLSAEIEVQTVTEGGQNEFEHQLPGRIKWQNLVLKRGITDNDALFEWFKVCSGEGFAGAGNRLRRRTGRLAILNPDGSIRRGWDFEGAFPVRWSGPSMAVTSSDVATEELEIAHHGIRTV